MKYFTDGFIIARKNPSPYGGGYTIVDQYNNLIKREQFDGIEMSSNKAEILGIVEALRLASNFDIISTDSMCCISWVFMGKSKARPDLNYLLEEARGLWDRKNINLCWERRNFNLAGIYNEKVQKERRAEIKRMIQAYPAFDVPDPQPKEQIAIV